MVADDDQHCDDGDGENNGDDDVDDNYNGDDDSDYVYDVDKYFCRRSSNHYDDDDNDDNINDDENYSYLKVHLVQSLAHSVGSLLLKKRKS